MRLIFDALAAPADSGGMRLHARETINGWIETFPDDRILVVGPSWLKEDLITRKGVRRLWWPNSNFLVRVTGEMLFVPLLSAIFKRYRLLSLSPVLSPLVSKHRSYAVSHDWRHISAPAQFSRAQLHYRRIWASSLRRASVVLAISEKTAKEIIDIEPSTRVEIVENGRDHARRWAVNTLADGDNPKLITFGHKNHKRPDLVIKAFARVPVSVRGDASLIVLGASGAYRQELAALARECGIQQNCEFPGFVREADYERLMALAAVVVLVSSDEGFGLPFAEAEYFGIPAIAATDSGLQNIHPRVQYAHPTADSIAAEVEIALGRNREPAGQVWTWCDAVHRMREIILAGVESGSSTDFAT